MLGKVVMAMNTILHLSAPLQAFNAPPYVHDASPVVVTVNTSDRSRNVSNAYEDKLLFIDRYLRSDISAPFSFTVSTIHDPVIFGTRIPIYRISALLDAGVGVCDVMKDYPSLTQDQIESAAAYARSVPNTSVFYPKRSLKSALRNMDFHMFLDIKS